MTQYFIADTHFGHARIIRPDYGNRPFKTLHEMDQALIDNWNARVTAEDEVVVAGDVAFYSRASMRHLITQALRGRKIMVKGDNDGTTAKMRDVGFAEVHARLEIQSPYGTTLIIHNPWTALDEGLEDRFAYIVHGHIHQREITSCSYWTIKEGKRPSAWLNAAVEHLDYAPRTLEELIAIRQGELERMENERQDRE